MGVFELADRCRTSLDRCGSLSKTLERNPSRGYPMACVAKYTSMSEHSCWKKGQRRSANAIMRERLAVLLHSSLAKFHEVYTCVPPDNHE